jgi:hypothetical protein
MTAMRPELAGAGIAGEACRVVRPALHLSVSERRAGHNRGCRRYLRSPSTGKEMTMATFMLIHGGGDAG